MHGIAYLISGEWRLHFSTLEPCVHGAGTSKGEVRG